MSACLLGGRDTPLLQQRQLRGKTRVEVEPQKIFCLWIRRVKVLQIPLNEQASRPRRQGAEQRPRGIYPLNKEKIRKEILLKNDLLFDFRKSIEWLPTGPPSKAYLFGPYPQV